MIALRLAFKFILHPVLNVNAYPIDKLVCFGKQKMGLPLYKFSDFKIGSCIKTLFK